jgi:acetylornithine aminotransferase
MNNPIIPFYIPTEKIIVKSERCRQYDSEGKQYIDFESGVWCANLGHGNERILKVLTAQAKTSMHHGYKFRNTYAEVLSEELNRIIGFPEGASVFLSSGSEAVNLAVTLARHITGRKKVLKISNSYLSAFGFGRIDPNNEDLVNVRFNDTDSIKNIDFDNIAAFVAETGGASVDVVQFPERSFMNELIETAKQNGCLIVGEEITTGMGRTGKWFGFMHYDFLPDIVVTGKALGNGYPISAVTVNKKIADEFNRLPFRYAQSHQNDPLGCSVGIEVIRIMEEENIPETSRKTGIYFKNKLESLKERFPDKIIDVRGKGLMLALELSTSVNEEYIHDRLFEKGFIVGGKAKSLRFMPPLVIETADIDLLIDALADTVSETESTIKSNK